MTVSLSSFLFLLSPHPRPKFFQGLVPEVEGAKGDQRGDVEKREGT